MRNLERVDEMIVLGSARDPDARSSRVLSDSPDANQMGASPLNEEHHRGGKQ
jgi:hypothetical protein